MAGAQNNGLLGDLTCGRDPAWRWDWYTLPVEAALLWPQPLLHLVSRSKVSVAPGSWIIDVGVGGPVLPLARLRPRLDVTHQRTPLVSEARPFGIGLGFCGSAMSAGAFRIGDGQPTTRLVHMFDKGRDISHQ